MEEKISVKQRVENELQELNNRLVKLKEFINNESTFRTLPKGQQKLLKKQYSTMKSYKKILEKRISIWID